MAEVEAEAGARVDVVPDDASRSSTTSPRARASEAIARLRELGHRVGLHAVWPNVDAGRALRARRRLAQPRPRVHDRAGRRRDQRDGRAAASIRSTTARTRTSTGATAARTRSCAPARSSGCSCSTTRRSGCTRARRWARRCGRCSRRRRSARLEHARRRTGSTSRELRPITVARHRVGRARERRRSCARCARTASARCGSSAPT